MAELLEFRAYVQSTQGEIRAERAALLRKAYEEERELFDDRANAINSRLRLPVEQGHALHQELLRSHFQEGAFIEAWADGADEALLNEQKANEAAEHLQNLKNILTPEQFEAYLSE